MRVLVVGGGGREHALAWRLSRDRDVSELFAAPGNPGIEQHASCVPINPTSVEGLAQFAASKRIDLTVIGPEAPLAQGIVDTFRARDLRIFGPDKSAARIETSKSFAKELCSNSHIPTPKWESFTEAPDAEKALDHFGPPWVVKADGLAAGKGTTVTRDRQEAETAIQRELDRGPSKVVLEEFIDGWEVTFMATVSGGRVQWLMPAFQDYKPAFDGDTGPNTGGMGCFSPVPTVSNALLEKMKQKILDPTVAAMAKTGVHYRGVLNLNAIIKYRTEDPYVLEFNARFGDPEFQGVASLVEKGLASHLYEVAENSNNATLPTCKQAASVVVVLASKGYPTTQSLGDKITTRPMPSKNVTLLHAGTAKNPAGEIVTAGGRVLNVVATEKNVESARKDAYSVIGSQVQFNGMHYRSDIGLPQARHRKLATADPSEARQ